ncbi:MAG TPA: Spy/CpxP family protein refolding chaperone [Gemmatimonadales bacterium]|nr:Spy/CpxP family protein refolding chaperone [Gemmatimonadales bacterium]
MTLLVAAPLAAQGPDDSPARAAELRRLIEERFAARVREELGLSDPQAARLRETMSTYFRRRRDLEIEERRLRQALAGQLRPGVAADQDSVARLTEALVDLKRRYVESYRDELRDLATFLDPVQRAQFFMLRERLLERVRDLQERRAQGEAPLRPRRRP